MDALALLCTLHAEGPRTLRLLREAGCRDVREFLALDSEVVSALLDVPPAVARRLAREGHHLAARVGTGFLEPEDGEGGVPDPTGFGAAPAPPYSAPAPVEAQVPAQPVETSPVPVEVVTPMASAVSAPAAEPASAGTHLSSAERQILDKVMQRWRENDGGAREPVGDLPNSPEMTPEPEPVCTAPEPVSAPPLEIAGLSKASVLALEAAGFITPQAVADVSTMALASAVGCSFGDARRYQFLATRVASTPAVAPAPKAEDETDVPERLIERPPVRAAAPAVVAPRPIRETLRQPEPEPKPVPELSRATPPVPGVPAVAAQPVQAEKTVLNWDFVKSETADPQPDEDAPQAGGPFA